MIEGFAHFAAKNPFISQFVIWRHAQDDTAEQIRPVSLSAKAYRKHSVLQEAAA
jgi:hypothetical protein